MSLLNSTDWEEIPHGDPANRPKFDPVKDLPTDPAAIVIASGEVEDVQAVALRKSTTASTVQAARDQAFVAALEAGLTPKAAAREAGSNLDAVMRAPAVQEKMKTLLEGYHTDAKLARALIRAKATKILLEGEDKDAINAGRLLAQDPELGMGGGNAAGVTHVHINDEVKTLILNAPAVPGIPNEDE